MKKGDTQLGLPETVYTDTKINVEALTGIAEGAHAYATDTNEPGWYDGAAWVWGAGGGGGDVFGPAGATDDDIVTFDTNTGKLIQDSGVKLSGLIADPATPEQGDILYWTGAAWVRLAHGTAAQFLKSGGHAANPGWDTPSGSGDVVGPAGATANHVALFDGVTGKLIKDGGAAGSGDVVGPAGATADDIAVFDGATGKLIKNGSKKISALISDPATPEQGDVLYWDGANWVRLAHGTSTQYLKSGGHAANPGWDTPAGGAGDMLWAVIQASQLVNEIKGWPPCVNPTSDLDALNLWWHKVGTPTTAPTVIDVSAAGLTDTFELAMKLTADAANEGLYQRFTFADEPRVKAGRVVSTILAIWSVSSVSVTAKFVNSDASHTDASAVTAAGWSIVTIENHTLAGTYCDLQVLAAAAGTFYVVPLGMNIGARAFPLRPRGLRIVDGGPTTVVSNADPGAVWTDVDITANASPLAVRAWGGSIYANSATGTELRVRRNGDTADGLRVCRSGTANIYLGSMWEVNLDDQNIFEYNGSAAAGDTEHIYLLLNGWWEWE